MPDYLREFASSSNGDRWFLGRDEVSGGAYVVHKANLPSGGAVTRIDLGTFLNRGPIAPEHQSLLSLIGTLADGEFDARGPKARSAPSPDSVEKAQGPLD